MRKAGASIILIFIFLVPLASDPVLEDMRSYSERAQSKEDDFLLSDWQGANSGSGSPRSIDFQGSVLSSGTSVIDATHPGYIGVEPPLGWSSEQLEGELDHLSKWVDVDLVNPRLDDYHRDQEENHIPSMGYSN
jgi:hypothetical protein